MVAETAEEKNQLTGQEKLIFFVDAWKSGIVYEGTVSYLIFFSLKKKIAPSGNPKGLLFLQSLSILPVK